MSLFGNKKKSNSSVSHLPKITSALDCSSVGTMIADNDLNIIYMNDAVFI